MKRAALFLILACLFVYLMGCGKNVSAPEPEPGSHYAQLILEMELGSQHTWYWHHYFTFSERCIGDTLSLYGGGPWQKVAVVETPIRLLVVDPGSYDDSTGALRIFPAYYDSFPSDTLLYLYNKATPLSFFLDQLGITVDTTAEEIINYIKGDTIALSGSAYLLKFYSFNAPWGQPTLVLLEN